MARFKMMDENEYLSNIYHILGKGTKAIFSHSNYSTYYILHSKCFMTKNIFACLANGATL